jgi:hypothetical protein
MMPLVVRVRFIGRPNVFQHRPCPCNPWPLFAFTRHLDDHVTKQILHTK